MKNPKNAEVKKTYAKPELKVVKIRPREVLGTECHNSGNTGPNPCGFSTCSTDL